MILPGKHFIQFVSFDQLHLNTLFFRQTQYFLDGALLLPFCYYQFIDRCPGLQRFQHGITAKDLSHRRHFLLFIMF